MRRKFHSFDRNFSNFNVTPRQGGNARRKQEWISSQHMSWLSHSIPPGIDDYNFDPEGDILLLKKLLNDDTSSPLPPKELNFKELKVIKSNVSMDFKDDYYDSEGDIIYLESLLIKDTILNLHPGVFLDHDPRSLEDEPDKDDLKNIVKVFDLGIWEIIFSPTYVEITL
ncbi:hypothetical protein Tco_1419700 [Tanacetum coccineum]